MATQVGINVLEVDGRASPAIQAAPTSVAAFIGPTERGVVDVPVRISSPAQFRDRFGGTTASSLLAYAVEGFFLNGGREAYVTRVTGAGSTAASATLNNRASSATAALRVAAGYRGREEPGAWGTRLRVDVRDDPRGTTRLTSFDAGRMFAVLDSLSGVRVGSVLRLTEGANTEYRRVTAVDPLTSTVSWASATTNTYTAGPAGAHVSTAEFRIIVRYQGAAGAPFAVVEEWPGLSMETDSVDYASDRINHPFTGSRYIAVTDLSGSAATGAEMPAITSAVPLVNGVENGPSAASFTGSAALRTGLHAFDTAQVQLLAAPDVHLLSAAERRVVVRAAIDYCAGRGDCMFVGSAPDRGASVTIPRAPRDYTQAESGYLGTIKSYAALFQGVKVYGALYAPWIQVADAAATGRAPTRFVPPDGHVMGAYARTELERGIWKAPAGTAAQVRGALDVSAAFSETEHTDLVTNGLVNGIRYASGVGITIAASRTLSSDTRWHFVGTRLLFNFVKVSLRDGLRFVRQEPHTEELRRMVRFNVVRPFLLGLWQRGAFGSDPADTVFTIKCDADNNPPNEVDLGNFRIEVYVYPVKPAETVLIVVGQQPDGGAAAEA